MPTVDSSERDNKETLFVKEEVTNDAEVFGEVEVDVEGSQKEPLSSYTVLYGIHLFTAGSTENIDSREARASDLASRTRKGLEKIP